MSTTSIDREKIRDAREAFAKASDTAKQASGRLRMASIASREAGEEVATAYELWLKAEKDRTRAAVVLDRLESEASK